MKKIFLAFALIAGVAGVANAQTETKTKTDKNGVVVKEKTKESANKGADPAEVKARMETARMKETLNLNDVQFQQVKEVNMLAEKRMAATADAPEEKIKLQQQDVQKYKAAQFQQILNPDQYKRWETSEKSN